MDIATLGGLILGVSILVAAIVMGGVPLQSLANPEALLVIFGGTMTAVMISFPGRILSGTLGALRQSLTKEALSLQDYLEEISAISRFIRQEGILALQPMLAEVDIPFLRKGLTLMMDNCPAHVLKDRLTTELEVTHRDSLEYARVFESAGGFAPTMGIIGALIGLIHIVHHFNNAAQLGSGIATAFSATLYGLTLSNLFLLPIAGKLRHHAREQWFRKTLIIQGLLSIQSGEHPLVLEEKLRGFIEGESSAQFSVESIQKSRAAAKRQQQPNDADSAWIQDGVPQPGFDREIAAAIQPGTPVAWQGNIPAAMHLQNPSQGRVALERTIERTLNHPQNHSQNHLPERIPGRMLR